MTLEELFKEACAKGITHFTLYPVPSQDGKTLYWCARATPSTGHSYVQTQTLNPIEAITEVLKSLPKAPKRVVGKAKELAMPYGPGSELHGDPYKEPPVTEPQPEGINAWLPKI